MTDVPDYSKLFSEIALEFTNIDDIGHVAAYIPELGKVNPDKLGIHLTTIEEDHYFFGDSNEKFTIQSIAKVLSLTLALRVMGEDTWKRVGVEPSGTPFNSLVQLEYEKGIPRNPFFNPGAIIICDILVSSLDNPKLELLEFIREISRIQTIDYSLKIASSEKN